MKDKIEQIIEDVMALPENPRTHQQVFTFSGGEVSAQIRVADLKLLATELLRLRKALAAAEECVGHYADDDVWGYCESNNADPRHYAADFDFNTARLCKGSDIAVNAQAEIKRLKGE